MAGVILRRFALHWYRRTWYNAIIRSSFATITWGASCPSRAERFIDTRKKVPQIGENVRKWSKQSRYKKCAPERSCSEEVGVVWHICRLPVCFPDNYGRSRYRTATGRVQLRFSQKSRLWLFDVPFSPTSTVGPVYTTTKYVIAVREIKRDGHLA